MLYFILEIIRTIKHKDSIGLLQIEKWIFDHFSWFPEGLYGEVVFFERDSDYEYIGERRKFLIYGHKLDEAKINVEGCGWKDLKNYKLYHILEKNLKS